MEQSLNALGSPPGLHHIAEYQHITTPASNHPPSFQLMSSPGHPGTRRAPCGFSRRPDAAGLRALNLLLQQDCLLGLCEGSAGEARQALLQEAVAVTRQLCALQPSSAAYAFRMMSVLHLGGNNVELTEACRTTMRLAHVQNGG